jgi:hypothetical protein
VAAGLAGETFVAAGSSRGIFYGLGVTQVSF